MIDKKTKIAGRQDDPLEERRRSQMSSARNVLERSTIMLLTSTKLCLRHPECAHSKENRDTVFCQMRRAMDLIHHVVKDGVLSAFTERRSRSNDQTIEWDTDRGTASSCLHVFARLMESSRPRYETSCLKNSAKSRNESMHSSEHADIINERRELMRSNSIVNSFSFSSFLLNTNVQIQ